MQASLCCADLEGVLLVLRVLPAAESSTPMLGPLRHLVSPTFTHASKHATLR
jgi:hypothetical protein